MLDAVWVPDADGPAAGFVLHLGFGRLEHGAAPFLLEDQVSSADAVFFELLDGQRIFQFKIPIQQCNHLGLGSLAARAADIFVCYFAKDGVLEQVVSAAVFAFACQICDSVGLQHRAPLIHELRIFKNIVGHIFLHILLILRFCVLFVEPREIQTSFFYRTIFVFSLIFRIFCSVLISCVSFESEGFFLAFCLGEFCKHLHGFFVGNHEGVVVEVNRTA